MGRAIVREPSVFLMDEPLSNLDAKLRVQMRAEVARVQQRIGVATLYVTHDQTEAMTLGHRVAVLRSGELQQCDVPQVLYDRPKNLFVAGFIGSPAMNLFEAGLAADLRSVAIGSQRIPMSDDVLVSVPGLRAYGGRSVAVGIRPEDLHAEASSRAGSELKGEVELVEALGSELLVHFRTDARIVQSEGSIGTDVGEEIRQGQFEPAEILVARIEPGHWVRAGDRFSFFLSSDRFEFFDLTTGEAIRN
jgi:multiple sugar transport system ATP-binding protein